MKRFLALGVALLAVSGFAMAVPADSPQGFTDSPAFTDDGGDHYTHQNGAPRFDWANYRLAVEPAQPGQNSASNSAIEAHGGDSLVSFGN